MWPNDASQIDRHHYILDRANAFDAVSAVALEIHTYPI